MQIEVYPMATICIGDYMGGGGGGGIKPPALNDGGDVILNYTR